jgi:uncharacterized protein YbjT (DUF2867 family)
MITILGATGNIGGKIADLLIKKGEIVRLVARSADRLRPLVGKNATAFAGDIKDTAFLVKAFTGVDAVFTLVPPDPKTDGFMRHAAKISESIGRALEISGVKNVVNLSSVGAELPSGTGPIKGLHHLEERLNKIKGLNVVHLRAAYFMENVLGNIGLIKAKGITGSAVRADLAIPIIATRDIAAYAADCLVKKDFVGSSIHYLLGQRDLTLAEATGIIGRKIGKTGLPYVQFPYNDAEKAMINMGLSPDMSRNYVEMSKAFNDGLIKPAVRTVMSTTPTSFEAFCDDVFMPLYALKIAA